jgi:hypothetical protein
LSVALYISVCCTTLELSSFHPRSIPQAVARGAGGRWCVVCGRCWALHCRCRCSTHNPPHEQLPMRLEVGGVSLLPCVIIIIVPPHEQLLVRLGAGGGRGGMVLRHRRRSTHDPPHKQLLVRLGAGGVLFVLPAVFCHSTRDPPHEQLLIRLGAGGGLFARCCRCSSSLPFSVIPPVIHPTSSCL